MDFFVLRRPKSKVDKLSTRHKKTRQKPRKWPLRGKNKDYRRTIGSSPYFFFIVGKGGFEPPKSPKRQQYLPYAPFVHNSFSKHYFSRFSSGTCQNMVAGGGETRTPNTVLLIIKVMSLACYRYITPRYKLGLFCS